MKYKILVAAMLSAGALFAQAPIPLTIDSRSPTAPAIDPYQASRTVYRVSFTDGTNPVNLTGITGWMSWSSNSYASSISTASVAQVGANANGVIDFTFSASSLNPSFGPGRYIYECGLRGSAGITVYRQGVLTLRGSPYAVGVSPATWTTNAVNWGTILWTGLPTTLAGYGIVDGVDIAYLYIVSNQAVAAQADIDTHEAKTGTNVHGLGTASIHASNEFATAAQGTLAGTALQSEADTNAIARLNTHTNLSAMAAHSGLGTAATNAASAFATSAQGATADTAGVNATAALAGVLAQSNRIDALNTATNALNVSVAGLKTATNSLQGQITALSTNAGSVANITALQAATNALNTRAGALEVSTNSMTVRILAGETATNALQGQVTALQGATNTLNAASNTLQTQITVLKAATNSLQTKIDTLNTSTGAQQVVIAALQAASNSLNTRAGNLETATNSLTIRVAASEIATNALNTRMTTAESATNSLQTKVTALQTATNTLQTQATAAIAATGALNTAVSALQASTNSLDTSVTALKAATNNINTRVTANSAYTNEAHTAYGWGDHAVVGYLTSTTNLFNGLYSANRAKLGSNLSGLTDTTYTGTLSSVAYTGVTVMAVGRTYAWGFTKANAFGTSTLSIASQSLVKTTAGATSNYFVYAGTDSNLILKLDGDGSSKSDVTAVYVKQITNGNINAAGDVNVGGTMYVNGAAFSFADYALNTALVSVSNVANGLNSRSSTWDTVTSKADNSAVIAVSNIANGLNSQSSTWDTVTSRAGNSALVSVSNIVDGLNSQSSVWAKASSDGLAATNNIAVASNHFESAKLSTNDATYTSTVALAIAAYPASNPSNYITAGAGEPLWNAASNQVQSDLVGIIAATNALNSVAGLLVTATNELNKATNSINTVANAALPKAGGVMSGDINFGATHSPTNAAIVRYADGSSTCFTNIGGTNYFRMFNPLVNSNYDLALP